VEGEGRSYVFLSGRQSSGTGRKGIVGHTPPLFAQVQLNVKSTIEKVASEYAVTQDLSVLIG